MYVCVCVSIYIYIINHAANRAMQIKKNGAPIFNPDW